MIFSDKLKKNRAAYCCICGFFFGLIYNKLLIFITFIGMANWPHLSKSASKSAQKVSQKELQGVSKYFKVFQGVSRCFNVLQSASKPGGYI